MSQPKRAIIYVRRSDPREENTSLETQEERCRAFCEQNGYAVVEVHKELLTAVVLEERPVMTAIRQRFRQTDFDFLVVWKYDRFSRDQLQQAIVLYEARKYGIDVLSTVESFESSPLGDFMRSVYGFVAQIEHANIKLRMMTGMDARVKAGKLRVSRAPLFGYMFGDETHDFYVENPETAPIVRRIFYEVADGTSAHALARKLAQEGIPMPQGGQVWNIAAVRRILWHPFYWGEPIANRKKYTPETVIDKTTGQPRRTFRVTLNENPVPLPASAAPALVPQEVAELAHGRLHDNSRRGSGAVTHPEDYLLRGGFIRCGVCGHPMHCAIWRRNSQVHNPFYYVCRREHEHGDVCSTHSISTDVIDTAAWEKVLVVLHNPDLIQEAVARFTARYEDPAAAKLEALEAELNKTERQRNNLAEAIATVGEGEDSAPLIALFQGLTTQSRTIRESMEQAQKLSNTWQETQEGVRQLVDLCAGAGREETHTFTQKQQLLRALGVRVTVWPRNKHDPWYTITLRPFGSGPVGNTDSTPPSGTPGGSAGGGTDLHHGKALRKLRTPMYAPLLKDYAS